MERIEFNVSTGKRRIIELTAQEIADAEARASAIREVRLPVAIKGECQRRIYAVIDPIAQVNLAAAAAGGVFTPEQMTVYRAGLEWIASMRGVCGQLIASKDQTYADNNHWLVPDAEIVELANRF